MILKPSFYDLYFCFRNVAQEGGKLNWILEKIQETTPEKKKSKGKKAPQFGEVPELPSDDDDDEVSNGHEN